MARVRPTFFIAGTDTGVGKTRVACTILRAAARANLTTAAVKPLAAGGLDTSEGLRNEDALVLSALCSPPLEYRKVNPLCLPEAIAPHIAAARAGTVLDAGKLAAYCRAVIAGAADLTLIEGAGGWQVPLNERECFSDVVRLLDVPVILVVGMRLGCLNHALLTVRAIEADGVRLAGWIANRIDADMPVYRENVETLAAMIPAPLLAEISHSSSAEDPVNVIDITRFINMDRSGSF